MRLNEERRPPPQPKITYSGKERFGTAHQNDKEMLQTYHSYLKSLYNRAYPRYAMGPIPIDSCTRQPDAVETAHKEQLEATLIDKFIKRTPQKRVRGRNLKMKPATYQDALTVTLDKSALITGENITGKWPYRANGDRGN